MTSILVVDDERAIREIVVTLLEEEGYRVLLATDGRQAIDFLSQEMPDLIVTDVMMPRMDGRDLLAAIRARPEMAHVPVLVMSAGGTPDWVGESGLRFLPKPFTVDGLLGELETLLEGAGRPVPDRPGSSETSQPPG